MPWENVARVLPFLDRAFADLKLPDETRHKEYTGRDGALIRENLRRLTEAGIPITVRIPLIPGVNDAVEDMPAFAEVISTLGEGLREVELLKYNNLADSKYEMTGRVFTHFGVPQENDVMEAYAKALRDALRSRVPITFRG